MLEGFRNLSQTWVAKVILALITIPFALFGMEYYFRQGGGGGAVLKVNGDTIGQEEYREALRNQQTQNANAGNEQDTPAMRYEALNALVNRQLLLGHAADLHLVVPDQFLIDEISRIELFQNNGKFSQARYEQVLKNQGMTPAEFERRLRSDLMVQLEQESLVSTSWVPHVSLDAFLRLEGQTRTMSSTVLSPASYLAQVALAPEAVRHEYDAHADAFAIPDQVDVEYLTLSVDQMLHDVTVSADEVRKAYDDPANQARWKGQETRRARHILLTVARGASSTERQAVLTKIQGLRQQLLAHPDQFGAVASNVSQDPGSARQGGDLGYFAHGVMTPPFEQAVFALKPGELSEPVETDFGYHLIQVTDVHPAKQVSLAEATPALTQELRRQKANKLFADEAESFGTLVYEQSGSLQPAAARYHLTIRNQAGIARNVEDGLWANPKLQEALFSPAVLKEHRNTAAIEVTPGTLVAARVTAFHAAHARPFAEVRQTIETHLIHEEAVRLARVAGEAMLKALREGKAGTVNWSGERQLNRQQAYAGALPGGLAVADAFRLDEHHLPGYVGGAAPNGDYVLVRVTAVQPGQTDDPTLRKQAEAGLTRAYGDEVLEEVVASLRRKATIKILDKSLLEGLPTGH